MKKNKHRCKTPFHQLIAKFERAFLNGITSPQDIATHFNAIGVSTLEGKRWNRNNVNEYLNRKNLEDTLRANDSKEKEQTAVINDKTLATLNTYRLKLISEATIGHYDRSAEDFWKNTKNHDVSQNHQSLLEAIKSSPPHKILDFGCGPGRDLAFFQALARLLVQN